LFGQLNRMKFSRFVVSSIRPLLLFLFRLEEVRQVIYDQVLIRCLSPPCLPVLHCSHRQLCRFINQKTVFDLIGVDLLAKTWAGFNASIFAYGQTGSGKTYSIMG